MTIREAVFENLRNAYAGSYAHWLNSHTHKEIAEDLIQYAADLEDCSVEEVELYVIEFFVSLQGLKK